MHEHNKTKKYLSDLDGTVFDTMTVDWRLSIRLVGDNCYADIVIEADCMLMNDGKVHSITPGRSLTCSPLLAFIRRSIESVFVSSLGVLTIRFSDRDILEVPPSNEFEAWQILTDEKTMMVCTPGGSVDVFSV